jgi:CheY-like chemotaxis protein
MNKVDELCIIDDDPIFVMIIRKLVQSLGFCKAVLVFKNGQEAVSGLTEILESGESMPDIIFLDLNMPKMNGWEFLDLFSKKLIEMDISVFIISSSINFQDSDKSRSYSCVLDYVVKPIDQDKLSNILKRYNEHKEKTTRC